MREVWIESGGVRLFAAEDGDPDGQVLVFLHGGLADHRAVRPLVQPLTERYRVVTPDVRGGGRSWSSGPLTFDGISDDLLRLLDRLEAETAFVGGMSSGSGPAVHFALRHPERTRALIVVHPIYAGSDTGYTGGQAAAFAGMDSVARRAPTEGIEVLRSMYFAWLPEAMAERAWAMASGFDAASVAATSRFIASGTQPFRSATELGDIRAPVLLVRGDDPVHPPGVSDAYVSAIPDCTVVPPDEPDITRSIGDFLDSVAPPTA